MPGDLLDLILLAVIAAFAVAGYRQGFIIGVLSLAGFVAGVAVGAAIAPRISRALASSPSGQAFLALLVVFVLAVIGMLVASGIGVAIRSRVRGRPATVVDSLGGAAVNVIAVVTVAWLIGSLVQNSPAFPSITQQVDKSAVLKTVDRVMPSSALYLPMFPQLRSLLSNGIYTPVLGTIGVESAIALAAPTPSSAGTPAQTRDERSIVKVTGLAPTCSQVIEGTGFVISPHHVLTNAHVVAGVTRQLTVSTDDGTTYSARVVLYDPDIDVAVLYVPQLTAPALTFAPHVARGGTAAAVAGYPENRSLSVVPARIGLVTAETGPNIYQTASVTRKMYPIRAVIQPGNSGGPLLSTSGQVYGVVFAAIISEHDVGLALTAGQVATDVQQGRTAVNPVGTQRCQSDG